MNPIKAKPKAKAEAEAEAEAKGKARAKAEAKAKLLLIISWALAIDPFLVSCVTSSAMLLLLGSSIADDTAGPQEGT